MIILKTPAEIEVMAEASRVVAEVLELLQKEVRPGISTDDLDHLADLHKRAENGKLQQRFPACVALNRSRL